MSATIELIKRASGLLIKSKRTNYWALSADSSVVQLCLQDQCQRQLSEHGEEGVVRPGWNRMWNQCNIWVVCYNSRLCQLMAISWSFSSHKLIKRKKEEEVMPPGEFPHPDSSRQTGCLVSRVKSRNSISSSQVYQRLCNPPSVIVQKREVNKQRNRYSFLKIQSCRCWTTKLEKRSIIIILQPCPTSENPFNWPLTNLGLVKVEKWKPEDWQRLQTKYSQIPVEDVLFYFILFCRRENLTLTLTLYISNPNPNPYFNSNSSSNPNPKSSL